MPLEKLSQKDTFRGETLANLCRPEQDEGRK